MRTTKRCFCNFSFYDQEAIQEKLESMAAKGWMISKLSNLMWTYQRMEPKQLRFAVTYFPNASEFDPGPTEGELTKMDFCAQDGFLCPGRLGSRKAVGLYADLLQRGSERCSSGNRPRCIRKQHP